MLVWLRCASHRSVCCGQWFSNGVMFWNQWNVYRNSANSHSNTSVYLVLVCKLHCVGKSASRGSTLIGITCLNTCRLWARKRRRNSVVLVVTVRSRRVLPSTFRKKSPWFYLGFVYSNYVSPMYISGYLGERASLAYLCVTWSSGNTYNVRESLEALLEVVTIKKAGHSQPCFEVKVLSSWRDNTTW